jgi:hypothetical protein
LWTSNDLSGTASGDSFWLYAFVDPAYPSIDMAATGAATGAALNKVDATSGETHPQSVLISRTGYSSNTDTLLNFYAMAEQYNDHNAPCFSGACWYPADYRIFKGNFLLAPDGDKAFGGNYSAVGAYWNNAGGAQSGYIELGGAYHLPETGDVPLNAKMPLAVADPQNRFAYALADSTASYTSAGNASRVHRHLIDFKKKATQQFVVVYDSVATTAGEMIRTYLHYPNNQTASADKTKGNTTLSSAQVTSSSPGTGNGDATQLLTQVLAPAGTNSLYVYTDKADGTYSGGSNTTFRVSVCASASGTSCDSKATSAEFVVVHEPVTGTANSLPKIGMVSTIDADHRGVEILGDSPKVAVFPRNGQTYTKASFTTTHAGTAQYLVTGLGAGTYNVTANGASVINKAAVDAGDATLYFESASGTIVVSP